MLAQKNALVASPSRMRAAGVHRSRAPLRVVAGLHSGESGLGDFQVGQKVKVTSPIKVYHVPKTPELNLEGMEGTIVKDVSDFKGQKLSAVQAILVEFVLDPSNPKSKFKAHMVRRLHTLPSNHLGC